MAEPRITPSQQRVLRLLEAAANAGQAAPSNDLICDRLGLLSVSTASSIVKRLEVGGFISVERFAAGREITILATGKVAPFTGMRTPRVNRGQRNTAMAAPALPIPVIPIVEDEVLPPRVDRDPCARCGTRRDIGCRHFPRGGE